MKERFGNTLKLVCLTALLGGFSGVIIWVFLKASTICIYYIWNRLPAGTGNTFLPFIICVLGGLVVGVIHRFYGNYPEELSVVMGKIQKEKHYDYRPITAMLICAFIPLICGASVGPEAGLTGIIAALCYWVGDNVTIAKKNSDMFSEIGEAVTLGQLFHSPLFGILAVEERDDEEEAVSPMSKGNKLLFYGISSASGFLMAEILTYFFGTAMDGFPGFSTITMGKEDFLMLLIYIPAGLLVFLFFELSEKVTKGIGKRIPVILRETLCGAAVGCMALMLPVIMFSGEEQMAELIGTFFTYSPLVLIGICLLKIIMTTFCINFGLIGGHFFPLIFACTCMGMGIASIAFAAEPGLHAAFAAAAVCATVLGAQLKKPVAVSLLLLLCFPVRALFCIFLCAVIGKSAASALIKTGTNAS